MENTTSTIFCIKKPAQCACEIALCVLGLQAIEASARPYVGASIGQTNNAFFKQNVRDGDNTTTSFELGGGYSFADFFAVEGSYLNIGSVSYGAGDIRKDGITASAVAKLPMNDVVEIFAKMGFYSWESTYSKEYHERDYHYDYSYSEERTLNSDTNLIYGFGVNFIVAEHFGAVLEYRTIDFDQTDDTVSNISLGARFTF